jgi:hypothetical protein
MELFFSSAPLTQNSLHQAVFSCGADILLDTSFGLPPLSSARSELDQNGQETALGYRKSGVKHLKVRIPNSHNPSFPICQTNFQYHKHLLWSPNGPKQPPTPFHASLFTAATQFLKVLPFLYSAYYWNSVTNARRS